MCTQKLEVGVLKYNMLGPDNKSRLSRIFKADDIPLLDFSCGGRSALAASAKPNLAG